LALNLDYEVLQKMGYLCSLAFFKKRMAISVVASVCDQVWKHLEELFRYVRGLVGGTAVRVRHFNRKLGFLAVAENNLNNLQPAPPFSRWPQKSHTANLSVVSWLRKPHIVLLKNSWGVVRGGELLSC
jgi:hypothetical protein